MGHDTPVGARLVTGEGLAEMHDVVEAGQQHLAQRDATDRAVPGDGIALLDHVAPDREQHLHSLGEEMHGMRGLAAGAVEGVEQMRRQTGVQRAAAGRIDVYAIALQAVGDGADILAEIAHHGNAARVVGDGTEAVHREDVRRGHKHAHRRHRGAEDAAADADFVREIDRFADVVGGEQCRADAGFERLRRKIVLRKILHIPAMFANRLQIEHWNLRHVTEEERQGHRLSGVLLLRNST